MKTIVGDQPHGFSL